MSETNVETSPIKRLVIFENAVESLKDLLEVQCSDGNWNYDPYMQGMANGMILALLMFQEGSPEFLEAPDVWLSDLPDNETKAVESVGEI